MSSGSVAHPEGVVCTLDEVRAFGSPTGFAAQRAFSGETPTSPVWLPLDTRKTISHSACELKQHTNCDSRVQLCAGSQDINSEASDLETPSQDMPIKTKRKLLTLVKMCLAELMCSFVFLFTIMALSVNATKLGHTITTAEPALATSFCAMALIYGFGPICGAHFNPAVTMTVLLSGYMSWLRGLLYILMQFTSGVVAASCISFLYGQEFASDIIMVPTATAHQAVMMETTLTAILCSMVLICAFGPCKATGFAGCAIGLTHGFLVLISGSVSGGAFNPARVLGPAIFQSSASSWSYVWQYVLGESFGAVVAAVLWHISKILSRIETDDTTFGAAIKAQLSPVCTNCCHSEV